MAKKVQKEIVLSRCDECDAKVTATVEGEYDIYHEEADFAVRFLLLRCPQCSNPLLVQQDDERARFAHSRGHDVDRWGGSQRLYPKSELRELGASVPEPIRKAFGEACDAFDLAEAYTASAIMCRKVLEGICDTHKAPGRNLAARLESLYKSDQLDKRLYEWITELRIIGNEAAHDVNVQVSREDASDLLDFTEAAAEYIYTFKQKFDEFKERRAKAKKPHTKAN